MNCQHCGATLRHRPGATTVSEHGTVHHHYRCPDGRCPVDGGMIVTSDGEVTRRAGPATDRRYELRTGADRRGTRPVTDGGSMTDEAERPEEIENVLRAEYEFSDEPLDLTGIDGIYEAIREVAETHEDVIVECEERIPDYKIYWNSSTGTVRVGAFALCASYEVPEEFIGHSVDPETEESDDE